MSSTAERRRRLDEVFDADGVPRAYTRPSWSPSSSASAPSSLVAAGPLRDAIFMRQGITFDLTGSRWRAPRPSVPA